MSNPAPIVVFAFNRPDHLKRTLDALAANTLAAESDLFIYCDGPRKEEDALKTEVTRRVAEAVIGFKSTTVFKRGNNFGLAANIIDGVTSIVAEYERVVVLEDDMVTSPHFLRYMNDGLDLYDNDPTVASIHGWCFPHNEKDPPKTFFLRGADCWGWATWKRAWDIFEPDADALLRLLRERRLEYAFNINGTYDYIGMLERVARGKNDSWAVRWLASAFLAEMYTLYSSASLVANIGLDGTGSNTGCSNIFDVSLANELLVLEKQPVEENRQMHEAFQRFNKKIGNIPPRVEGWKGNIARRFMSPGLKALIKDCLPPIAVRNLKKYRQRMRRVTNSVRKEAPAPERNNVWQEGYSDWQSACAASGGYDSDAIFAKVRDASRKVRDGKAVYERDSVLFDHIEYSWPLLAGLLWMAARHGGKLRLIDFGGSLGSAYRQNRLFLQDLKEVRWNVVEQAHFVQSGQEEFQTEELRFFDNIEACLAAQKVDGILFGSVLQYIEEPYALLEQVCGYGFDCIFIDRTPFSKGEDLITVQNVPESIYKASYPCHFLDRKRVESILTKKYMIQEWFDALGGPGWYGLIARKK